MSDWKFRYKLLDVLFRRWGIVVPEMTIEKVGQGSCAKVTATTKILSKLVTSQNIVIKTVHWSKTFEKT